MTGDRSSRPVDRSASGPAALAPSVSSRQFLRLIERVADIGTWIWEPATGVLVWSQALHRMMKTDPATYQPRMEDLIAMAHPDDRWIVEEKIGPSDHFADKPVRFRLADGTIRWHVCHKEPVPGSEGKNPLLVGIVQDVTEARTAHAQVMQRQRIIDAVIRLVGGMLWRSDAKGDLIVDRGWCEFTGTTIAQNVGQGWIEAVHPDDRGRVLGAWRQAVEHRTTYGMICRVRRFDGVYVELESKASPLIDEGGKVLEWIGFCAPVAGRAATISDRSRTGTVAATPRDLEACRAFLGWSISDLARTSGVSVATITRYEGGTRDITMRPSNMAKLMAALTRGGVEIIADSDGSRVIRFRANEQAFSAPPPVRDSRSGARPLMRDSARLGS